MCDATKKKILNKVCKQLNAKGLTTQNAFGDVIPFSIDEGELRGFKYLPMENIKKLSECDIEKLNNFKSIYAKWGRQGILNFEPYEYDEYDGYPTLVLRHNRFLQLDSGKHFQASENMEGYSGCNSNSYDMLFLVQYAWDENVFNNSLVTYMLWWAALIDTGFHYKNFIELFNKDKTVIEKFLHANMKYWMHPMDYTWEDVERRITVEKGNIDFSSRKVFQIYTNAEIIAYLAIGKQTVQVETSNNRLLTIHIPDFMIGTNYLLDETSDYEQYMAEAYAMQKNHYLEMLAVMALKLAGVHISFVNAYAIDKSIKPLRPINAPNVPMVNNLNAIYGVVPDEF